MEGVENQADKRPKLYYFNSYGRAEPIRVLLNHAKVDYENVEVEYAQYPALKEKMGDKFEFGQVPVLEWEGEYYAQSFSIFRMLGRIFGYYPVDDAKTAWRVDSTLEAGGDLIHKFWETLMNVFLKEASEADKEKERKDLEEYTGTALPKYLGAIQKRLINNGGSGKYLIGESVTLADIDSANIYAVYLANEAGPYYKQHQEVLQREEYASIRNYFRGLESEIFKDYFDHRAKGRPY